MTNFEKYKDDLIKMNGDFAVDKNTKEIAECNTLEDVERCIDCVDCIFFEGNCFDSDKLKWLYEEYKEPVLSNDELELINTLSKINGEKYKYIFRTGGTIFLFSEKPHIGKFGVRFTDERHYLIIAEYNNPKNLFLNIKYEDGLYDIENKCFIKE